MKKPSKRRRLGSRAKPGPDQLRLMVDAVLDYAIFTLDKNGRVSTWNRGAERIHGYKASDIIGKHFSIFYPEEDIKAERPRLELEIAEKADRFEEEGWRVRRDGSKFWANVVITPIRDQDGRLIGYGKVTRDVTERKRHEEKLARSEELFRLLVEGARDYAIFMMNAEGKITSWNTGAERIKGYTASEIIGRHYSTFFPEQDVKAGKPQEILELAAREGHTEQEGWRVRKDGSLFWVNAIVTAFRNPSGELLGFSKITRDVTEKMEHENELRNEIAEKERAQSRLRRSEDSLRLLSVNLLRTQDEERRRIGREMHDSLGQYLSALKMKLGVLRVRDPNLNPEAAAEFQQCNALLEECVKEVRTISYLLYPPMLEEMGLRSAITWYLDGFSQRSGIQTSFDVSKDFGRVSRDVELAIFRVLQESLTNAHKHSGTSKVDIQISRSNGTIDLQVRDYGKGLPQAVLSHTGRQSMGVGLRGMMERMMQIGGTLGVSDAAPGTLVHAQVPAQGLPETETKA